MKFYLSDTHALFWYLTDSPKLGPLAGKAFDEADIGQAIIYVPSIVLAELFYLNSKLEHPLDFGAEFAKLRASRQFVLVSFIPQDVLAFDVLSSISEMHDRIIGAISRRLGVPCLTKDLAIGQGGIVSTIW